jgi:hypothetical protein
MDCVKRWPKLTEQDLELLTPGAPAQHDLWIKPLRNYDRYNHVDAPVSHTFVRFG